MTTRFPIQQFVTDLVISDRRLSEHRDLKIDVGWQGRLEEFPYPTMQKNGGGTYGLRFERLGHGSLEIITNHEINSVEHQRFELLALLLIYCKSRNRLSLIRPIGRVLKGIRESFGMAQ